MQEKYLVVGGTVVSQSDGQECFVSAAELVKLYKLDPAECILAENKDDVDRALAGRRTGTMTGFRWLGPRADGDYSL